MAASQPDQPAVNDPSQPQVIEIRQDQHSDVATVIVQVPSGIRHVTLQSLTGANNWVSRAVAYVDGSGKNLRFRVPAGVKRGNLRVLGDANNPLSPATAARAPLRSASNAQTKFALLSTTKPLAPQANIGALSPTGVENNGSTTAPRSVTESDIWKIRDHTLYFFNQLRGLQIIDITNADAPVRRGKLALPAVGEDMYILDDTHVILLARKGSRWDQSEIIAVTITDGTPAITARIDVNGTINASRLVGTALYVATDSYQTDHCRFVHCAERRRRHGLRPTARNSPRSIFPIRARRSRVILFGLMVGTAVPSPRPTGSFSSHRQPIR